MKKRSRFLQVPIEPFTIEPDLTADAILEKMERISFQGRSLGVAHRVWQKMLDDDVTIFMGMAGALSAGGLRMVVAYLIQHRFIDCLVSTGANLYHDLHETRGQHHYVGSPHADDAALAENLHRRNLSPIEEALAYDRLRRKGLRPRQASQPASSLPPSAASCAPARCARAESP